MSCAEHSGNIAYSGSFASVVCPCSVTQSHHQTSGFHCCIFYKCFLSYCRVWSYLVGIVYVNVGFDLCNQKIEKHCDIEQVSSQCYMERFYESVSPRLSGQPSWIMSIVRISFCIVCPYAPSVPARFFRCHLTWPRRYTF